MRKNKIDRKNLKNTDASLYVLYRIRGNNLDGLVNSLQKKGIGVYRVRKTDGKTLIVGIKFRDSEKFFAICNNLWYTDIKKVKEYGKALLVLRLIRNFGVAIGTVLFVCIALFADGFIMKIDYVGTGAVCKREVREFLSERGIGEFSRFSDVDLKNLSAEILANNSRLVYAACQKRGNRLIIELALRKNAESGIAVIKEPLVSDVNGVVEEVRIYRGTATVKTGDEVKVGNVLANPYAEINGVRVEEGLLAYIAIKTDFYYEYFSESDDREEESVIFAENALGERYTESSVEKTKGQKGFVYKVRLSYKRILYSGMPKE